MIKFIGDFAFKMASTNIRTEEFKYVSRKVILTLHLTLKSQKSMAASIEFEGTCPSSSFRMRKK